jgi:hypothetical protein
LKAEVDVKFVLVVEIVATSVLAILVLAALVPIRIATALGAFGRALVASLGAPRPKITRRLRAKRKIPVLAEWRWN